MVLFTIHKTYIYLLIYTVTIFSISLSFFNQKRTFFLITWPWTLTYDLDLTSELDRVMSRWTIVPNIYASKAISFWSYCRNTHTHAQRTNRTTRTIKLVGVTICLTFSSTNSWGLPPCPAVESSQTLNTSELYTVVNCLRIMTVAVWRRLA